MIQPETQLDLLGEIARNLERIARALEAFEYCIDTELGTIHVTMDRSDQ